MAMNVIARRTLVAFGQQHPDAMRPLLDWHNHCRRATYTCFADVRADFGSADWVKGFIIFNIAGNKYRLVALPNFPTRLYVKHVFTHKQYDDWRVT